MNSYDYKMDVCETLGNVCDELMRLRDRLIFNAKDIDVQEILDVENTIQELRTSDKYFPDEFKE